jgi:4-carboxymuconolactone decarboxylase
MDNPSQNTGRRANGLDVLRTLSGGDATARADSLIGELGALGSYVVDHVFGTVWSRPGLGRRDRSLIVVAMLVALGGQYRQLAVHVKGALNHGLDPDQIREIAIHLCGYAGFPRAIEAMRVINETLGQELGDALPPMLEADHKDDAERRADGIEIFQRLTESPGGPDIGARVEDLENRLGALADAAIYWGFGELWARPQLSQRDRSLVIMAVLAATGRTEQLSFHVPGALNNGVTARELEEVILMVSVYAGFPVASSAIRVVRELTAPTGV